MNYQFFIDGNLLMSGNIAALFLMLFIVIVLFVAIIITVTRKLRYNEGLKYEFITIIAHKFRTPLTHLKWLTETLLASEQNQTTVEGLHDMAESTDRLISLTGSLIELTNANKEKLSNYQLEKISLCELGRTISSSYRNLYREKNLVMNVQCETKDILVNADKKRLEFVVQTLLENAYTYSPPGRTVEVTVFRRGRKAVLRVLDHGIGIDPKDIHKLFTKFYRTPNAQATDTEGFGIALFLARKIVSNHKGKLQAFSEGVNHGATFEIILPMVK